MPNNYSLPNKKIPDSTKQYQQPNGSDLLPNIYYTKNCDFDEPGYIKSSYRTGLLKSNRDDSNFGVIPAFGRFSVGQFLVPTKGDPYVISVDPLLLSVAPDSGLGKPTDLGFTTHGRWWNSKWHVTSPSSLYFRKAVPSNWTNITLPINANLIGNWNATTNAPTLKSGIGTLGDYYVVNVAGNTSLDGTDVWNVGNWVYFNGDAWVKAEASNVFETRLTHTMEVFRNRNTLCVADGHKILQFDTAYVHQKYTDLILQSDYEVVGMAYSGNRLGIITRLSDESEGENIDAYFFVWDGASPAANAGYPIGSDQAIAIAPYKSSWVILTRKGQLLYFNGGGFDVLGTFPFYFQDQIWGDFNNKLAYGDAIEINGDFIYINVSSNINLFGLNPQSYTPNFPSGIWCYDPKVGLYHRYSPSSSQLYIKQVLSSQIDTSTDTFTTNADIPSTGNPVRYVSHAGGNIVGGLSLYSTYYVIRLTATTFQLAQTKEDALNGVAIDITDAGAGFQFFYMIDVKDFGISRSTRCGAVGLQGVHSQVFQQLIFSTYIHDGDSDVEHPSLCMDIPHFDSRSYFVMYKVWSDNIEDNYPSLYIKYNLLEPGDSIRIRFKNAPAKGLPYSTQNSACTWNNDQVFTTTQNLADVLAYFQENGKMSCEIIDGNGSGQISTISSISLAGSTYTVTLEDNLEGATNGKFCDICIDNFKFADEIDSNNPDGYKEVGLGEPSKWLMVMVEMRGKAKIKFEECQFITTPNREG